MQRMIKTDSTEFSTGLTNLQEVQLPGPRARVEAAGLMLGVMGKRSHRNSHCLPGFVPWLKALSGLDARLVKSFCGTMASSGLAFVVFFCVCF